MNQIHRPLLRHLVDLRGRLLHIFSAIALFFVVLVYFANDIYTILAEPLLRQLPEGTSMIATGVATPFLTPMKLTLIVAIFLAIPYMLYQVWAFIAPGLYKYEKRLIAPLVFSSALLFYVGAAFAYFVVFPLAFAFFTNMAPEGVTIATDITSYLDFVLGLFIAFGIAFEIPIFTILLCWTGVATPKILASKRPYVIVVVFIVGMLLTPPDIISQTLLAIPMWLLFEMGVFLSRFYVRKPDEVLDQAS